jgi:methylenetetrahydrofolate reductase (NADPH)
MTDSARISGIAPALPGAASRGFSFEFFPPKGEVGRQRLNKTVARLAPLRPRFVSVTFGAGGSTREGSFHTASEIMRSSDLDVTPHLSCIGSTRDQIAEQLETYRTIGVRHIVALRGDVPADEPNPTRAFRHANELVAFIREFGGFRVSVACYPEFHPEAPNPSEDVANFVRKVEAGADEAITQYFYNNDAYFRFVDWTRRLGVDVPIIPGLMPLTDYKQVVRFSKFCGAEIPQWIRSQMEHVQDEPDAQEALGIDIATWQADALLRGGAPGIHFYTLNRAEPTLRVWQNLGLSSGLAPAHADAEAPTAN